MSMKSLTPLLAFSFLIGCDGEKSNVAPSKDSPDKATSEAPSYGSLDEKEQPTQDSLEEQQSVTQETKNTSLPPIPEPMDAEAIIKLWSMDHNPTGFIEEMKIKDRPGTWEGIANFGPAKDSLFQSEEFSYDSKWVDRRFTVEKFSSEANGNNYLVATYLPDEDSFILWALNNGEITQAKGKRLEKNGIKWRSTILSKSAEEFYTSRDSRMKPTNDGFELNESQRFSKDGTAVGFSEAKAYWTGFPGMKPLGKKEILELAKLPHNPDLKDPEIKWMLPKAGIWKFKETVSTRDSEQEEEFTYENVTKRVDKTHTVFTNFKDGEIVSIGVAVPNPNKETEEILRVLYSPNNDELVRGISFLDEESGADNFKSLRQKGSDDSFSIEGKRKSQSKRGSSNFASAFSGILKFRDDGKLMRILKFEGEWVKELPAEGGEISEELLEKKLAEIGSEKETEKSEGAERLLTLSVDGVEVTAKRIIKDFPKFEYFYITSSGAFSLDELRIGKTYASVTGDPLSNDPNIIFSDSFDYLEGEKLLNQDGWFTEGLPRNMSSSAESFNIQKGSLISGGKKSAGNRLSTESTETISGIGIKIADKASFKNGDNVYLSYLIRPEGTIGDGVYGGYFGVGLKPINQDGIFFGKPGDHEQYGIEKQGGPLFAASGVEPEVNKTSFVVVKIESNYSGKEVRE